MSVITNKYRFTFIVPREKWLSPVMEHPIIRLEFNRYEDADGEFVALTMWDSADYGHFCSPEKTREFIVFFSLSDALEAWFRDSPNKDREISHSECAFNLASGSVGKTFSAD